MRALQLLLLIPLIAAAQLAPSLQTAALVRGVLLECDAEPGGQFSVRTENNQVLRYRFDGKTYVERDKQMVAMARLSIGEKIEVVSDVAPGSPVRYARTIHVLQEPPSPPRPPSTGRLRPYRPEDDRAVLKGNLTYSGIVVRVIGDRLVIRTRDGELMLTLRKETRYLEEGVIVSAAVLQPNTRVFIRAGKNVYDQVEAYQVIWGAILNPQ